MSKSFSMTHFCLELAFWAASRAVGPSRTARETPSQYRRASGRYLRRTADRASGTSPVNAWPHRFPATRRIASARSSIAPNGVCTSAIDCPLRRRSTGSAAGRPCMTPTFLHRIFRALMPMTYSWIFRAVSARYVLRGTQVYAGSPKKGSF
jgi:hypothetical protein